jgi:hypothetical protein
LVDQAYLLPGVEAKLIAAYDPKQRAETDLPCLENDDPLVSMNEEHLEHRELLRPAGESVSRCHREP